MTHAEPALLASLDGTRIPLLDVSCDAIADNLVFEATFRQRYRNDAADPIEAVYTFPLPSDAILLGLACTLGDRRLTGVVAARKQAEQQYEDAIDAGNSAVLLERSDNGLYTVSLGNLLPGEEATIEVRYGQLLKFAQGSVRIGIPTTIAPRFGDPLATSIAPHAVPETDLAADYPARFTVALRGHLAKGQVDCPAHEARIEKEGDAVVVSASGALDRDFIVNVDGLAGRPLCTLAPDGDGWVAICSFLPEVRQGAAADRPRRVKILVDCSGSMAGDSIAQARAAVLRLLDDLGPEDWVSVSAFGSRYEHQRSGFARAGESHLEACRRWARALDANMGGTNMRSALRSVFELGGERSRDADVVLITDGEVWETDEIVATAREFDQRVFAVGVGSSPAESLLARLADATGGAAEFVSPSESIEAATLRLAERTRQPRARDLRVVWPAQPEWQPALPGTVFGGQTLHAIARFAQRPAGEVTLHWADDETRSLALALEGASVAAPDAYGPARIAAGLAVPAQPKSGRAGFAERYQLITADTSMVLVLERAEGEKAEGLPRTVKVKQMLAAGWGGAGSVVMSADLAASSLLMAEIDDSRVLFSRRPAMLTDIATPDESFDSLEPSVFQLKQDEDLEDSWPWVLADRVNTYWARSGALPVDLESVSGALPEAMLEDLRALAIAQGITEGAVIAALIQMMAEAGFAPPIDRGAARAARRVVQAQPTAVKIGLARIIANRP